MSEEKHTYAKLMEDAEAFHQQVRIAAVQVAGLKPEELTQALSYEVEPFSGIPAAEAELVYKPIPDPDPTIRVYDVAVKRRKRHGASHIRSDRWLKGAILFACIVVIGIAMDAAWIMRTKARRTEAVNECRPLQSQLDRLHNEARRAQAEAQAIRSKRETTVRAHNEADRLRRTHADLLDGMATACEERAVVTSITTDEESFRLRVRAVGISAEDAADVMRTITLQARQKGWMLTPGAIVTKDSGTTATFEFDLHHNP